MSVQHTLFSSFSFDYKIGDIYHPLIPNRNNLQLSQITIIPRSPNSIPVQLKVGDGIVVAQNAKDLTCMIVEIRVFSNNAVQFFGIQLEGTEEKPSTHDERIEFKARHITKVDQNVVQWWS